MTRKHICVAILNYNGKHHLEHYLPQVLKTVSQELILVIDNCSTDDSVSYMKKTYPEIDLLVLDENYGFAGGYNEGLKSVHSKYILLLNSDVATCPEFLEIMVKEIESDPSIAAVQPTILSYNNPDKYEYAGAAGGLLDIFGYPLCRGRVFDHLEMYSEKYSDREIFWATGACMLVRNELFKSTGGFAADFFAHLEEIDLCWRWKRMGYKIKAATKAKVKHLGGGTLSYQSSRKTYLNFRNSLCTLMRNEKVSTLLWLMPFRLILDLIATLMFLAKGETNNARAVVRARRHYYGRLNILIQQRKELIKMIRTQSIGTDRSHIGRLKKSIVFNYYVLGKKDYEEIIHHA
jgi:GT2 family glycosyltransferase